MLLSESCVGLLADLRNDSISEGRGVAIEGEAVAIVLPL